MRFQRKNWPATHTFCPTQKLVSNSKMTKTGCLLSIFMPYAIVKPIDTRFQKAPSPPPPKKNWPAPPTSCPTQKWAKTGVIKYGLFLYEEIVSPQLLDLCIYFYFYSLKNMKQDRLIYLRNCLIKNWGTKISKIDDRR